MHRINNKKSGFTLIELLVVIAIISLLSSIVFASLSSSRDKARIGAGKKQFTTVTPALYENAYVMWRFDESGVGPVTDFGPLGNNGTISSASVSWVSGIKGNAVQFDGTNNVISNNKIASSSTASSWTLAAWVNMTALPAGSPIFVSRVYPYLSISATSGFRVFSRTQNATDPTTGRKQNTWYYVVGTYSVSTNLITLYVDGKQVAQTSNSASAINENDYLYVAQHSDGGAKFTGILDEVYFSGSALLASEVQHLYAQGLEKHQNLAKN